MASHGRDVVERLAALIALRTDNPAGDEPALCRRLLDELAEAAPDALELLELVDDDGVRRASVYAAWGRPVTLLNAHVDTVPVNAGWTRDPFTAEIVGERLYGLGAADTKGAVAAIVGAARRARPRDVALLLSGDEEHGGACLRAFLASGRARGLARAVVCEPTSMRVGTRHRGILALEALRRGEGGHSSRADRLPKPLVDLARVAVALDDLGRRHLDQGPPGFEGLCVNVGALRGGVAFNVVPEEATLIASLRPPPGADVDALLREVDAAVRAGGPDVRWRVTKRNPPLATAGLEGFRPLVGAQVDAPVDLAFWTEAAELATAGIDAVVLGPGDIAQAHGPDEHVELAELRAAEALFVRVLEGDGR